jgi:hypothetical protein
MENMYLEPDADLSDFILVEKYALTINGYEYAEKNWQDDPWATLRSFKENNWQGSFEDLRCCLFLLQRLIRHYESGGPALEERNDLLVVYGKICELWRKVPIRTGSARH